MDCRQEDVWFETVCKFEPDDVDSLELANESFGLSNLLRLLDGDRAE